VTAPDPAARAALELLTPPELAALLGVKVQTLAAWRVSGDGPPYCHVGRWVRYRRTSVEAWLAAQERASTSDRGGRAA
jgi:predicted DNA-binding transcriptional regulator AlpA